MEYLIYIPRGVYSNNSISDLEFTYYVVLSYLNRDEISTKEFFDLIYGKGNYSEKRIRSFHPTLSSLITKGIIKAERINRDTYSVDISCFKFEDNYARIPYEGLIKILRSGLKNTFQLVRYYCWLLGSRNGSVGCVKLEYFAEKMECNIKTIYRYNEQLENMQLIYIVRSDKYKVRENNSVFKETSCYGEYKDRLAIDKFKSVR